ncbi:RHS repeat domain-containing protein [Flavobacterium sp.]
MSPQRLCSSVRIEVFNCSSVNHKIASATKTSSLGVTDILATFYEYHTGNSPFTQNRISEIEQIVTKRNNEVLSNTKINYSNNWIGNQSFLPQTIQTSKGSNTLEDRLRYNSYDVYGHPLEVKRENGMPIRYIWGYNNTQPIAKIENATYSQVQSYVANLQTLSNGVNEANLISALNSLRSALPNAMITTYTYKPLVGVSTITDSKGDKITYEYDSFGRLKSVKDRAGNILSENEYHYRTQN